METKFVTTKPALQEEENIYPQGHRKGPFVVQYEFLNYYISLKRD